MEPEMKTMGDFCGELFGLGYPSDLQWTFARLRAIRQQLRDGKITRDQHDAEKRRILKQAMEQETACTR